MAKPALTSSDVAQSQTIAELESERETRLVLLFLGFVFFLLPAIKMGALGFGIGLAGLVVAVLAAPRGSTRVDQLGFTSPFFFAPRHFPASEVDAVLYDLGEKRFLASSRRDPSLVIFHEGVPISLPTPKKPVDELEAFAAEANRILGIQLSKHETAQLRSTVGRAKSMSRQFFMALDHMKVAVVLIIGGVVMGSRELSELGDRPAWILLLCLLAVVVGVLLARTSISTMRATRRKRSKTTSATRL